MGHPRAVPAANMKAIAGNMDGVEQGEFAGMLKECGYSSSQVRLRSVTSTTDSWAVAGAQGIHFIIVCRRVKPGR